MVTIVIVLIMIVAVVIIILIVIIIIIIVANIIMALPGIPRRRSGTEADNRHRLNRYLAHRVPSFCFLPAVLGIALIVQF